MTIIINFIKQNLYNILQGVRVYSFVFFLRGRSWRCPSLLSSLHPCLYLLHCTGNIGQQLHTTSSHNNVILNTNLDVQCIYGQRYMLHSVHNTTNPSQSSREDITLTHKYPISMCRPQMRCSCMASRARRKKYLL